MTGEVLDVRSLTTTELEEIVQVGELSVAGRPFAVFGCSPRSREFTLVAVETTQSGSERRQGVVEASAREADGPFLLELERVIEARQTSTAQRSYTRLLLDGGAEKIGGKLREEASELAAALVDESDERVANEAADVVFHLLVGLRLRDVKLRSVIEVLARRLGVSGHVEKATRRPRD